MAKAHPGLKALQKSITLDQNAIAKKAGIVLAARPTSEADAHSVTENETQKHNITGEPGHVQAGERQRTTKKSDVAERHVTGGS